MIAIGHCSNCNSEAVAFYRTESGGVFCLCYTCKTAFELGQVNAGASVLSIDDLRDDASKPVAGCDCCQTDTPLVGKITEGNDACLRCSHPIAGHVTVIDSLAQQSPVTGCPNCGCQDFKGDPRVQAHVVCEACGMEYAYVDDEH